MNGIEGAGSIGISCKLLSKAGGGITEASPAAESQHKPGMRGAMTLCREFLSKTIAETGFVDLRSSTLDQLKSCVEHRSSQPEEPDSNLDPLMAAEIAGHFGDTAIGEVNAILRLLARIDPERVAALLR